MLISENYGCFLMQRSDSGELGRSKSNPAKRLGLRYLFGGGATALPVLGGVFFCATGAEVLYADMGHFGRLPIRLVWSCLVFPALLLNYTGQAAIVLAGTPTEGSIFFRLCPAPLLLPMVLLATAATIIASQAVITGAFSMTRQAIQLGLLPRLQIVQTSAEGYGQIYLSAVNYLLMLVTLALAVDSARDSAIFPTRFLGCVRSRSLEQSSTRSQSARERRRLHLILYQVYIRVS
jgi:K+ transporter